MNENELYHFGVKGMKWGVRRNRSSFVSTSGPKRLPGTYASDGNGWTAKAKRLPGAIVKTSNGNVASAKVRMKNAKQAYKTANKVASKSFDEAYKYTDRHPIKSRIGKGKQKSNALWDDAIEKIDVANKAKATYKQSKKDYKTEKKTAANTPEAQARKEKLKKAAKVGAAVAGTALAAYGVYKVNKFLNSEVQKKYASETKRYLKIADGQEKLAKQVSTWASESRDKASYNAFLNSTFNHGVRAEKARDTAYKYWDKADQSSYSTREKYDMAKDLAKSAYQTYKNRRTRK